MAQAGETAAPRTPGATTARPASLRWAWVVLVLSLIGLVGSLHLSIALGLKACPLCFYQRTFVMGVFGVLSVGLMADRDRAGFLCLLSLPLTFGGLGVAAFHEYLVQVGKLECPNGILGLGTAPAQSLTIFVLLTAVTALGAWVGRHDLPPYRLTTVLGAIILGLVLTWGAVASVPPMPPAPPKPYDPEKQPLDICRPPFRSP